MFVLTSENQINLFKLNLTKISNGGVLTINIVWCKSKYRRVLDHVLLQSESEQGCTDWTEYKTSDQFELCGPRTEYPMGPRNGAFSAGQPCGR